MTDSTYFQQPGLPPIDQGGFVVCDLAARIQPCESGNIVPNGPDGRNITPD